MTAAPLELPDPFRFASGNRVATPEDWRRRRLELLDLAVDTEYGGLPPTPSGMTGEPRHSHRVTRFLDATYTQYRLINHDAPAFHFRLDVLVPGRRPWQAFLEFMAWQLNGRPAAFRFDRKPFPELPPACGWQAPSIRS